MTKMMTTLLQEQQEQPLSFTHLFLSWVSLSNRGWQWQWCQPIYKNSSSNKTFLSSFLFTVLLFFLSLLGLPITVGFLPSVWYGLRCIDISLGMCQLHIQSRLFPGLLGWFWVSPSNLLSWDALFLFLRGLVALMTGYYLILFTCWDNFRHNVLGL